MPVKTKDYPIYTYDEPAVYKDFSGGINSDPSNEHLLNSEMRDCVNMTYLSGALVKRRGAKKICDISCEDDLINIQGIFLFTYRITYIILAADGKLYSGIYTENSTIQLTRLQIVRQKKQNIFSIDEQDSFTGLDEMNSTDQIKNTNHEGFVQTFFTNLKTGNEYLKNERGSYYDVANHSGIYPGDLFVETIGLVEKRFLCVKAFEKEYVYPNDTTVYKKWILLESFSYNGTEYTNESDMDEETKINAINDGVFEYFNIKKIKQWQTGDIVVFNHLFYKCIEPHYNRYDSINDPDLFVDVSVVGTSDYVENSYMLFQNYRKVEAATINNKLYIATGTRIIEVYLFQNELKARPVEPYLCNYTEITKIGYNYMSPYPELAVASQEDTVTTSISGIKVQKTIYGKYLLTPVMNIQIGDSINNYYFRWEKYKNGTWYTVIPYASQKVIIQGLNEQYQVEKKDYSSLEVDDANECIYRCSFAKSFELESTPITPWNITSDYAKGQFVSIGAHIYKCLKSHSHTSVAYINNEFDLEAFQKYTNPETGEVTYSQNTVLLWDEQFELETVPFIYYELEDNVVVEKYGYINDYIVNKVDGEYFGSATSVIFNDDISINDDFLLINSCTKVIADGNKLLFYGDRYNSGQWFKTIINNPGYITDRGNLSFKTNKNESVIKVVPFQGNLIVFANAENVGGSIHLVQGNGDDYDDQSGYYSPYQRRTINASISCSNAESIQVCDNIIVFKYFNRVYYINASDLNNDTVKVTPCNDRILYNEGEVRIPWDDDDCISEVNKDYYALIWKEKYTIDSEGELVKEHPGIRVKMYYKMTVQYSDNSYGMPWLRDESNVFNANNILYVKGNPLYLYQNVLLSFNEKEYKDIDSDYECYVHLKGVDMNYESFYKLIQNCSISFHRNQFNNIDLDVKIKNEAGHTLIDSKSKRFVKNDLGTLFVGQKINKENYKIGSTIQDNKIFIAINQFPCMLADAYITAKTEGSFTLSGITYSYTTIEQPDTTTTETYTNIIRPED